MRTFAGLSLLALALLCLAGAARAAAPQEVAQEVRASQGARTRLSLANLLRGLFLTDGQLQALVVLAREADEARARASDGALRAARGARERFEALQQAVVREPAAQGTEAERLAVEADHEVKRVREAWAATLQGLQGRATAVLTPGQRQVVAAFPACVVPPRTLTDPELVGQAAGGGRLEALVDVLRRAPEDLYRAEVGRVVDAGLGEVERAKGAFAAGARAALRAQLLERLTRLRAMSDADYALGGAEEAKALVPFSGRDAVDLEHWAPGKVGEFLLAEGAADVLERWRLARRAEPAAAPARTAAAAARLSRRADLQRLQKTAAELWRAAGAAGVAVPWADGAREQVEVLVARNDLDGAVAAAERAVDRLAALPAVQASVAGRRLRIERLVRERRLEAVFAAKELDLFGLPKLVAAARAAWDAGRTDEVLALADRIEALASRFRP